jgi:hypothetical protein
MSSLCKRLGFALGLVAALLVEPALAKTAPPPDSQRPPAWYRSNGDVRDKCVERSFSVSVGNPAYPNRLAVWPAPCRP